MQNDKYYSSQKQNNGAGKKDNSKCHTCHKKGHFSRNCPNRKSVEANNYDSVVCKNKNDHGLVTHVEFTPEFALETGGD